jgi:glucose/arabinose dehydrogenase
MTETRANPRLQGAREEELSTKAGYSRMIAVALAVALAICLLALAKSAQGAVKLPSGFALSEVVGHVNGGTDMEFAPDGRLFVNSQPGLVRIVKPGKKLVTFLDISAKVDDSSERGLMEIAFDPKFSKNHYVYLYYTTKATSKTPAHNRVVRVTAKGDKAVPGSERLILQLPNQKTERHMGGSLEFGKDGKLYISVGENNQGDPAQSLKSNLGKILRINKDGTIPTDNPFYKKTSANNRAIWALGFRNPFKITRKPGTNTFFENDVGGSHYEEINRLKKGGNYGWPTTEGPTKNPKFVTPIYSYKHSGGTSQGGFCCAITGGAFYESGKTPFPKSYARDYFFTDNAGGWIKSRDHATGKVTNFASGIISPRDLEFGKGGSLYVLGVSKVQKIRYTR